MCRPKDNNPLLRQLLAKKINPLRFARAQSPVGSLYIIDRGDRTQQIILAPDRAFETWPAISVLYVATGERGIVEDSLSSAFNLAAGLGFLGRIVPGMGSIEAKLAAKGVKSLTLKLQKLQGQRADANDLVQALAAARLKPEFAAQAAGKDLFLVTGAWAAERIEMTVDDSNHGVDVSAEMSESGLSAAVTLEKKAYGRILASSEKPLFFGAEMMMLEQIVGGYRLKGYSLRAAVAGGGPESRSHIDAALVSPWGDDDEAILDLPADA